LRVGIAGPSELGINSGHLIGVYASASPEGHVLLRMSHPRKAWRRFVAAHQIVLLNGNHWSERVPYDDDSQPIFQGGSCDVGGLRGFLLSRDQRPADQDNCANAK
jgi:hypothetical protein